MEDYLSNSATVLCFEGTVPGYFEGLAVAIWTMLTGAIAVYLPRSFDAEWFANGKSLAEAVASYSVGVIELKFCLFLCCVIMREGCKRSWFLRTLRDWAKLSTMGGDSWASSTLTISSPSVVLLLWVTRIVVRDDYSTSSSWIMSLIFLRFFYWKFFL